MRAWYKYSNDIGLPSSAPYWMTHFHILKDGTTQYITNFTHFSLTRNLGPSGRYSVHANGRHLFPNVETTNWPTNEEWKNGKNEKWENENWEKENEKRKTWKIVKVLQ